MEIIKNQPRLQFEFSKPKPVLQLLDHKAPDTQKKLAAVRDLINRQKDSIIQKYLETESAFIGNVLDGNIVNDKDSDIEELLKNNASSVRDIDLKRLQISTLIKSRKYDKFMSNLSEAETQKLIDALAKKSAEVTNTLEELKEVGKEQINAVDVSGVYVGERIKESTASFEQELQRLLDIATKLSDQQRATLDELLRNKPEAVGTAIAKSTLIAVSAGPSSSSSSSSSSVSVPSVATVSTTPPASPRVPSSSTSSSVSAPSIAVSSSPTPPATPPLTPRGTTTSSSSTGPVASPGKSATMYDEIFNWAKTNAQANQKNTKGRYSAITLTYTEEKKGRKGKPDKEGGFYLGGSRQGRLLIEPDGDMNIKMTISNNDIKKSKDIKFGYGYIWLLLLNSRVDIEARLKETETREKITPSDIIRFRDDMIELGFMTKDPPKSASAQNSEADKIKFIRNYVAGSGMKRGRGIKYYKSPEELKTRMTVIVGEINAGNNSKRIRTELADIADNLLKDKQISRQKYNAIYKKYIL